MSGFDRSFPVCISLGCTFAFYTTSKKLRRYFFLTNHLIHFHTELWQDLFWNITGSCADLLNGTWVSCCALRGAGTRSTVKWSSSAERAHRGSPIPNFHFSSVRLLSTHSFIRDWTKMKDFGKVPSPSGSPSVKLADSVKWSGTPVRLIGHAGCVGA